MAQKRKRHDTNPVFTAYLGSCVVTKSLIESFEYDAGGTFETSPLSLTTLPDVLLWCVYVFVVITTHLGVVYHLP